MRLVVVSDSHGSRWNLFEAVEREPSAEVVYFLGDGYREYEELFSSYSDKKAFIGVNGNCDLGCTLPAKDIRNFEGKRIYATHGYAEKVKFGVKKNATLFFSVTHISLLTHIKTAFTILTREVYAKGSTV